MALCIDFVVVCVISLFILYNILSVFPFIPTETKFLL